MSATPPASAVVVGGTGTIGRHVVGALLERGPVVVATRSAERFADVAVRQGWPVGDEARLRAVVCDVGRTGEAERLRAEAGPVGALAVCAGRWYAGTLAEATDDQLKESLGDNYWAHWRTLAAFAGHVERICVVTGDSALRPPRASVLSSPLTAAVLALTRALAVDGLPVAAVVAGRVHTGDGPPAPGTVDPAAVAAAVCSLLDPSTPLPSPLAGASVDVVA